VVKVRQEAKEKKRKKDEVILDGFHRQHWDFFLKSPIFYIFFSMCSH
jgi:hypothetical protein